jgi:hypothetical protein
MTFLVDEGFYRGIKQADKSFLAKLLSAERPNPADSRVTADLLYSNRPTLLRCISFFAYLFAYRFTGIKCASRQISLETFRSGQNKVGEEGSLNHTTCETISCYLGCADYAITENAIKR